MNEMKIKNIVLTITLCQALLVSSMLGVYTGSASEVQGSATRSMTAEAYFIDPDGKKVIVGYVTAKGDFTFDGVKVTGVTDKSSHTKQAPWDWIVVTLELISWGKIIDGGNGKVFAVARYFAYYVFSLKCKNEITTSAWVTVDANGNIVLEQSGVRNIWVYSEVGERRRGGSRTPCCS